MVVLLVLAAGALVASVIADRKKTVLALKKGLSLLLGMLFPFLAVLTVVSLVLVFLNEKTIAEFVGREAGAAVFLSAALIGAVSLLPGVVAFPLSALLLGMGAAPAVVAVFLTTLMMVGVVTLPLEAKYFGWKTALLRNGVSFIAAAVIGLGMGALWNLV